MCKLHVKYEKSFKHLTILALLLFCYHASSQSITDKNYTGRISPVAAIQIRINFSFFPNDSLFKLHSSLIPSRGYSDNKSLIFFDSLKIRASKNSITKKLYDFIIVSPTATVKKQISGTSDAGYIRYTGKRIRKIEIQRLDVFGTDINNPVQTNPKKADNVLNKTHVNTNENIIRKNLLFSIGDTISPLTLSDNERILRQLSFIQDARIIVFPVSDVEADIVVLTKDVYSLGGSYSYKGLKKGSLSLFEKNILGLGHELGVDIPFDSKASDSPGFGIHYTIDNIRKSFINLTGFYLDGIGEKTYGFTLSRKLISATTKYAGGISIKKMFTSVDLNNTLIVAHPLKYNYQDYWLLRSFLINQESVSRIIIGARYIFNNVFDRPFILPDSYYYLQNYRLYMASAALSIQKYYKTNLIYGYGRTEDIPYGGLIRVSLGNEYNEFHNYRRRTYLASEIALGKSNEAFGYVYGSAGLGAFLYGTQTEQGIMALSMKYFSNLINAGSIRIRNFVNADYIRGFGRNTDEHLVFSNENGFSGFKNDSINGTQRLSVSLESELFSPVNIYGFRFAFFGFTDFAFLSGSNELLRNGNALAGLGLGMRLRNDNLVFNTFQIRIGFFPNPPLYSKINVLTISGEQLLRPNNFDSGPPALIPYR
jgi:hypothetical protein